MIQPIDVMCFFFYVLDYVNYQKLKLNFLFKPFLGGMNVLVKSKDNSITYIYTFASKNVIALSFLQISLFDCSDFLF